jgi:hypothetical protein
VGTAGFCSNMQPFHEAQGDWAAVWRNKQTEMLEHDARYATFSP